MTLRTWFFTSGILLTSGVALSAKSVVDVMAESSNYKTFTSAMEAAGLSDEFKAQGPFTIFAPTDQAFAKLPADVWPTFLKPENKAKLVSLLTHHIVPSKVVATGFHGGPMTTLNGRDIDLSLSNGKIHAGEGTVTAPDLVAANGIVHGIDTVLLP